MAARYTERLAARISATGSHLCVGLDPRLELHNNDLSEVERFLNEVIAETHDCTALYKPNIAYFEAMGVEGHALLKRVIAAVPDEIPVLLDAKRSDIGETQRRYAHSCFEVLGADAVTINPFMGYDSLEPFLDHEGKGIYLLAVTSNAGSADLQQRESDGRRIYEYVGDFAERAREEGRLTDVGLVVGMLTNQAAAVLNSLPDVPLLIPGLGAQGGDLDAIRRTDREAPNVINVSRGVTYGDVAPSHGERARHFAKAIRSAMV